VLFALDESGNIVNPYSLLPAIELQNEAEEAERTERVNEGTGAMIAYQRMAYGGFSDTDRNIYRNALLKYCGLDTLAMVLIWEYWVSKSRPAAQDDPE